MGEKEDRAAALDANQLDKTHHLPEQQIHALHGALVRCGLADSLDALLAGIDRSLIAGLPWEPRPNARLLRMLHELNEIGQSSVGGTPLKTFLDNALALTQSQPDAEVLRRIIFTLDLAAAPRPSNQTSAACETTLSQAPRERRYRRPVLFALIGLLAAGIVTFGVAWSENTADSDNAGPMPSSPPLTTVPVIDEPAPPSPSATGSVLGPLTSPQRSVRAVPSGSAAPAVPFPDDFDQSAAEKALGSASKSARQSCRDPDSPSGVAIASVTFGSNGTAKSASVTNAPFKGTPVGRCVETWFMRMAIPPFTGNPVSMSRSVALGP